MNSIANGGFSVGVTYYVFEVQTENDGWMKIIMREYKSGALSTVYVRAEEFLAFFLGQHRADDKRFPCT